MHNRKIELAEGIILIEDAGKSAMDAENLGVILSSVLRLMIRFSSKYSIL